MTWAESSSPAEVDLLLAPPLAELPSELTFERPETSTSDLAAEIGSWSEAPVALAEQAGLCAMGERAQALGYLWVELPPPGPEYRGRLGLYIEEGLETRLDQLGAPPAGIHASSSLDASLSDQLYRARFVERRGLALGIPSLEGIANLGRTLDADDSSVLRWWVAATADRPVRLVVSSENQFLRIYPSPVLFDSLFELAPEPVSPRAPSVELAESARAMEMSDLPPSVEERPLEAAAEAPPAERAATERAAAELSAAELAASVPASEPTTNVLGTRVAPILDVALPGLDRALGLLGDDSDWEAAPVHEARASTPEVAVDRAPRDDIDAIEQERREAVTLVPPAEEFADAQALTPVVDAFDGSNLVDVASLAPPAPLTIPTLRTPNLPSDPPGIDAAEFLRVLEQDSRPPPAADLALGPADEERIEVPTPLPAKKLRRPFLRMAETEEPDVEPGTDEFRAAEFRAAESEGVEAPAAERLPAERLPAERLPAERVPVETAHVDFAAAGPVAKVALTPPFDPADPFNQLAIKEWGNWRDALSAAAGPRPLAVIERMFVTDYTRLAEAVRRGIGDESARAVLTEWQASFQKSYAETFDALRVRGKRPTMVLDLPDIAQRLGRLQGARRVQLLLIDGLRFDLGLMVQERLRAKVDAALTERLLLWSALPSTTTYQLELLGKGPEGLLERWDGEESPALVARGRAARAARRIRTGRVEVQKIDVVEDALRTLGRPVMERFDEIASEAADAIAEHMAAQPARTLVIVFGDHGFRLDPSRAGTTEEVRQGGSSPEEVLVPAFAWLTGAVH